MREKTEPFEQLPCRRILLVCPETGSQYAGLVAQVGLRQPGNEGVIDELALNTAAEHEINDEIALDLEYREIIPPEKPWAVKGTPETRKNLISSIFLEPDDLEDHQRHLERKYQQVRKNETRWELYDADDADILLVGYGITSRILRSAVEEARSQGQRVGLFRPITLWPFPSEALARVATSAKKVLVIELSNGQMVEDVRLALNGKVPVEFYGRTGGNVPSVEEIHAEVLARISSVSHTELLGHFAPRI